MNEQQLRHQIEASQVGSIAESLYTHRLPCIDFVSEPASGSDSLDRSRIGGPFLAPEGFEIPIYYNEPMNFLCQLSSDDLNSLAPHLSGHLLFFASEHNWTGGHRACSVIHVPHGAPTKTITPLPSDYLSQNPCILLGSPSISVPVPMDEYQSPATQPWHALPDSLRDPLCQIHDATTRIEGNYKQNFFHRFLGHPDIIQYDERKYLSTCEEGDEWLSLLAIYDDHNAGISFGDTGAIHFYIRRSSFEQLDFSDVQCHLETC